ncbi:hypothetical protein BGZ81_000522, partial [Podila clonocystis]
AVIIAFYENANGTKCGTQVADLEAALAACKVGTNSGDLDKAKADATACHEDLIVSLDRERKCEERSSANSTSARDALKRCKDKYIELKRDDDQCHDLLGKCVANIAANATDCQKKLDACQRKEAGCEDKVNELGTCKLDLTNAAKALDSCKADLASCNNKLATNDYKPVEDDLAKCKADNAACQANLIRCIDRNEEL